MVVTHYLYRRYCMGHRHIADNVDLLYAKLKAIRRGVEPLSYVYMVEK